MRQAIKITMNKKQYLSPAMKVVGVKAQQLICGSLGGGVQSNNWTNGSESIFLFGDEDD